MKYYRHPLQAYQSFQPGSPLFFLPVVILLLLITICHLKNSLFMYAIYALALLEINYKTHTQPSTLYLLSGQQQQQQQFNQNQPVSSSRSLSSFFAVSPIFFFFIRSHSFNRFHLFCPFCLALFIFGDFSFSLTLNCRHISRFLPRPVTSSIRDSRSGEAHKVSPE